MSIVQRRGLRYAPSVNTPMAQLLQKPDGRSGPQASVGPTFLMDICCGESTPSLSDIQKGKYICKVRDLVPEVFLVILGLVSGVRTLKIEKIL